MKKLILILPIILLVITIHAQPGIKAGVNISNFTGGDFGTVENNSLTSFHAGLYWRIRFNHFAIQPELLYSEQGAKLTPAQGTEQEFKMNYINVPVMFQWIFNGGFYVEAGPQAGFKVNEDVPVSGQDFAKDTEFAGCLGLGYQASMGLGIGARYTAGFSKLGDFDAGGSFDPDFKSGVWQFSLFYTLFVRKNEK